MSNNPAFTHYATNRLKIGSGVWTTASAVDAVTVTGFQVILAAVASFVDDLADDPQWCSASFDPTNIQQLGGNSTLTIKTWKNTSGSDPTPQPATVFGKQISWIVVGY